MAVIQKKVCSFGDVYVTEINIKAQIISIVGIFFYFSAGIYQELL